MTFKFGNPVSTEWDKIKEFVFRKEILDVSCQDGKVIQLLKKQVSRAPMSSSEYF